MSHITHDLDPASEARLRRLADERDLYVNRLAAQLLADTLAAIFAARPAIEDPAYHIAPRQGPLVPSTTPARPQRFELVILDEVTV